ncbi:hypothetical protein R1sor_016732 [Riccia sorocarpa]|uniref:F-box domain-containing protein n=1 Tax=Riccia sorocarpa TaxID=122646 RepID=A0ABD3HFS5_9MARC
MWIDFFQKLTVAIAKEFARNAREMVFPKSQICDKGCEVFVGSHTEELTDENRSKRLKLSGRERQKTVDDVTPGVKLSPELPGEIVEKIISLIPFRRILTARALSNEWRLRLSAQASNSESVSFRELVKLAGASWPVYFPLVFNVTNRVIRGLDSISWTWVTLSEESLDFEAPSRSDPVPWELACSITGLGSLVCFAINTSKLKDPEKEFLAYNIFTQAWKWLPPRPACEWLSKPVESVLPRDAYPIYVIPDGADRYKVLVLVNVYKVESLECQIGASLYDSRSSSWTIRLSSVRRMLSVFRRGAYCNGVIYFGPFWAGPELLQYSAYIVESGYWEEHLPPLRLRKPTELLRHKFIVWENQLLLLSWATWDGRDPAKIRKNSLILYKVDPVTGDCDVIYRGPPESIPGACSRLCLWHGDSIFFEVEGLGKYMMEFNIRKHTWTLSPPSPIRKLINIYFGPVQLLNRGGIRLLLFKDSQDRRISGSANSFFFEMNMG